MEKDYRKIGGWLIFYLVSCGLTIIMVVTTFSDSAEAFSIFSQMGGDLSTVSTITQIGLACAIGGSIAGISAIVMRKKKVLNIFYILILLSTIFGVISMFMFPSYLESVVSSFKTKAIIAGLRDLIVLGLWFRYFKVSTRAKVYFGEVAQTEMNDVTPSTNQDVE